VGLKYFEDFEKRIPREEVTNIVQIITEKVNELAGGPGIYDVTCCGSYRRYFWNC
jgi:DNA polymerase beta